MNIKEIVSQMTLEEKCSLLSGQDFWNTKAVERLGVKPVAVSDGPHGLRKQDVNADHLGINDAIPAVCYPAACAGAASFDRDVMDAIGKGVGAACRHEKVAVSLGPAINIKRSPLCGRNFEYFSEDPYLAGEMAAALVNGLQSKHVGASVKHFAANSQENRRMSADSVADERTLREIYFPAFETVVKKAHPWTVMCSYNKLNGTYACENRWLLTDVLRGEWGFDGYVVSDWGATDDRVACLHAGMDLEMPSSGGANDKRVVDAVRAGRISEADVDLAVERILTVHERYLKDTESGTEWDKEAQHAEARTLAADCMVLLKNEDNILPLKAGSMAVIGKFAAAPRYQGGGSSHINSFKVTSLLDALADTPGVVYAQGYDTAADVIDEKLIAEAVGAAKNAKTAVIVAGLPDAFESEGYDRTHMRMPDCQNELIRRVAQANPNTVVVLYNGSPVEMPWLGDVKAVLEGYLGGQNVGGATYDVLFGRTNPSGRLPESFPRVLEQNPSYLTYGGEGNTVHYSEGVFVGYRYYTKKKIDVLFPFGYGLSYTTFAYSNLRVSGPQEDGTYAVTVDVTNTGKVSGKEVVQLYVAPGQASVFRPVRELKGFAKLALQPGETKTASFTLDRRAFAYWHEQKHDWHVEGGEYSVQICRSADEVLLEEKLAVAGDAEVLPELTINTIMMDLMKNPVAMETFKPLFEGMMKAFTPDTDAAKDVSSSAVNEDMGKAMIMYMPLRALAAFSGGMVTFDQLEQMVQGVNQVMKAGK